MLLNHGTLPIAASTTTGPRLKMSRTTARTSPAASSGFTRHPPSQPSQKKNRRGHRHGKFQKISPQPQNIRPTHFSNLQCDGTPPNFCTHAIRASVDEKAQK